MNYLIVYNNNQLTFSPTDIHKTITEMKGVTDWWHYLPNVYIVSTFKDEKFIADSIISKHPGLLFLVVLVDLRKHNGVLNKNAWEWISNKVKAVLRVKPATPPPPNPLFDLLLPQKNRTQKSSFDLLMEALKKRANQGY